MVEAEEIALNEKNIKIEIESPSDESDVESLQETEPILTEEPRRTRHRQTQTEETGDEEEDDGWKTGGRAPAMSKENLKVY